MKDFDLRIILVVTQVLVLHHSVHHDQANAKNDRVIYLVDFLLELLLMGEFHNHRNYMLYHLSHPMEKNFNREKIGMKRLDIPC